MFAGRNRNAEEAGTRELAANTTLRVEPGRLGVVLRAERGILMVTQAGDREDHVLTSGEMVRLPGGGLVVALALAPARLSVEQQRRPPPKANKGWQLGHDRGLQS
jgi:hypothetical protein